MTITEHLQFSVLSAPIAALDRRALSQAWYSALYGQNGSSKTMRPAPRAALAAARSSAATATPLPCAQTARRDAPSARGSVTRAAQAGNEPERRSPRCALARKIERALLHPRARAGKASFRLEGEHGRVHVLLQSSGAQLKIVAICPPKARASVAAALAQARYALAQRGIALDAQARSEVTC